MSLEIKGKVTKILEPQTGTSAKGEWSKQEFILQTEGDYPKSVCIESWNNKIDAGLLKVGNVLNVSINLESREFNGRWYSTIKAWKAEVISSVQAGTTPEHSAPIPAVSEPLEEDDMPF